MSVTKVDTPQVDQQQREKVYQLLIVVLVGVLVATWVAVVWLVQGKSSAEDDRDKAEQDAESYAAGPDAQAAAEEILAVMTTYGFRDTKADLVERWTAFFDNDELKAQYENDLIPGLVKAVKLTKTEATGTVEDSAYSIVDADEVDVLAFVRQEITSKDDPKGVIDAEWFSVSMVRHGDAWLVREVRPYDVPPPAE